MSTVQISKGGSPVPAASLVNVDGKTVLGDGSNVPLSSVGGSVVDFVAAFATDSHLGAAVRANGDRSYAAAIATSLAGSAVLGLVSKVNAAPTGHTFADQAQGGGLLTLTAAQWDVVTDESGGLTPSAPYYLSAATGGHLTQTPPVAMGSYVVLVGIALDATTMAIRLGSAVGPHA